MSSNPGKYGGYQENPEDPEWGGLVPFLDDLFHSGGADGFTVSGHCTGVLLTRAELNRRRKLTRTDRYPGSRRPPDYSQRRKPR